MFESPKFTKILRVVPLLVRELLPSHAFVSYVMSRLKTRRLLCPSS